MVCTKNNCHHAIVVHLLFNTIYLNGFVRHDFGKEITILVPVPITSLVMFHRLTVTGLSLLDRLFLKYLLLQFDSAVEPIHLQLGFKNDASCPYAIFLLKKSLIILFATMHNYD